MNPNSLERDVRLVCELVRKKPRNAARTIVAIAGPPASGKSTLADAVVQILNKECGTDLAHAALLPMDGYHLDNRLLEERGLLARKGAPETFDSAGFCDAVKSLVVATRETFHPKFDRQMDLGITNAIAIHPNTSVVVVEGNYLLLTSQPWSTLTDVFDATVFVSPPIEVLRDRLRQRWISYGLDHASVMHRAESNDLPNAALVMGESRKADLVLNQNHTEFGSLYAY